MTTVLLIIHGLLAVALDHRALAQIAITVLSRVGFWSAWGRKSDAICCVSGTFRTIAR